MTEKFQPTKEPAGDKKPLTLREYIGINPLPTLDDLVDLGRWSFKGAKRLWFKVFTQNS